jgi:hypothetical protein
MSDTYIPRPAATVMDAYPHLTDAYREARKNDRPQKAMTVSLRACLSPEDNKMVRDFLDGKWTTVAMSREESKKAGQDFGNGLQTSLEDVYSKQRALVQYVDEAQPTFFKAINERPSP